MRVGLVAAGTLGPLVAALAWHEVSAARLEAFATEGPRTIGAAEGEVVGGCSVVGRYEALYAPGGQMDTFDVSVARFGVPSMVFGDFDDDGLEDTAVGDPNAGENGSSAGTVRVFFGPIGGAFARGRGDFRIGACPADLLIEGSQAGGRFGYALSTGDVNGDGITDLLVGAPGGLSPAAVGAAYLFYGPLLPGGTRKAEEGASRSDVGRATSPEREDGADPCDEEIPVPVTGCRVLSSDDADAEILGESPSGRAGRSLAIVGDVDSDGFDDILVGAPGSCRSEPYAGAAFLFYGPLSGRLELASADAILEGESTDDSAGFSVSRAGDVDGDGYDDLLVGAFGNDSGGEEAGAAYLVLGPVEGKLPLGQADLKLVGPAAEAHFGAVVAPAGDIDEDGRDDLLVVADYGGNPFAATDYLFLGAGSPLDSAVENSDP